MVERFEYYSLEDSLEIGWIMGGFFVFMTIVYIAIALLAPEWVGIQGKVAKEIEKQHQKNP